MEPNTFGNWLRLQRKGLDLTREAFADRVGCSAATIRKIEAEERRPSAQIVERLADIFSIPPDQRSAFLRFARGDWQAGPRDSLGERPWRSANQPAPSILPLTTTTLIGRAQEVKQVRGYLLNPDIRLATLVGPPGIGKTRLSLAAARDFPTAVFFVALAPLDNPLLLAPSVVHTLGYVAAKKRSSTEQLRESIGDQPMLIVLDNCEHLIEEVALLVIDLLGSCSQLKILATSRESLRVPGEWLYAVPALRIPKENSSISIDRAAEFPALTLFAERARAARPDFVLDNNNIGAVSALCTQLDGLPLAIELIAARVRLMSPRTLLDQLNDQFTLFSDGMRTTNTRHKTLHNAIGWSYNLLSADEQTLLARLAVFSGGFTLNTAEAIFSQMATGRSIADLVTSLWDKSLLQRAFDERGDARFSLLVTIQKFALDRLRRLGEAGDMRQRHVAYFLELAKNADEAMKGLGQIEWSGRLYADRDNLYAALNWTIESGQAENALNLARHLFWFWFRRSDFNDARLWLGRAIALPEASLFPGPYAEALCYLANNYWLQTGPQEAKPLVEKALAVARAHGDQHNVAQALRLLGQVLTNESDFANARRVQAESLALHHALGDDWEESAHVILAQAFVPYMQKDWAASLALHQQALAGFRRFGDIFFQTVCLRFVGKLQVKQGEVTQGTAALSEALSLARQLDSKYEIGAMLLSLGEAAQYSGHIVRAVCLYVAAKNSYVAIGAWMQQDEAEYGMNLETCRAILDELAFRAAVERGQAMTMEQAVEFALEERLPLGAKQLSYYAKGEPAEGGDPGGEKVFHTESDEH